MVGALGGLTYNRLRHKHVMNHCFEAKVPLALPEEVNGLLQILENKSAK